jgi:hypothetical protein
MKGTVLPVHRRPGCSQKFGRKQSDHRFARAKPAPEPGLDAKLEIGFSLGKGAGKNWRYNWEF